MKRQPETCMGPLGLFSLTALARGIVPLVFATDLLRSLFIPRLFLPALVRVFQLFCHPATASRSGSAIAAGLARYERSRHGDTDEY
jgi:hypothetical protein